MHNKWIYNNLNWGLSEQIKSKMVTKRATVTIQPDVAGVYVYFSFHKSFISGNYIHYVVISRRIDLMLDDRKYFVKSNLKSKIDATEIT